MSPIKKSYFRTFFIHGITFHHLPSFEEASFHRLHDPFMTLFFWPYFLFDLVIVFWVEDSALFWVWKVIYHIRVFHCKGNILLSSCILWDFHGKLQLSFFGFQDNRLLSCLQFFEYHFLDFFFLDKTIDIPDLQSDPSIHSLHLADNSHCTSDFVLSWWGCSLLW